jgi:hypothetical protein
MQIRNLKGVVFQFKRAKVSNDGTRRFSIRYSDTTPPRQLDTVRNYAKKFGHSIAYYALPLVTDHSNLNQTLERTAFINALAIPDDASVIHIPESYCSGHQRQQNDSLYVHCSDPSNTSNTWSNSIEPSAVFGWDELFERITACDAGFKIRYRGQSHRGRYHEDHQYFPQNEELHWTNYDRDRLFGLTKESAPVVTRFGSDTDEIFG